MTSAGTAALALACGKAGTTDPPTPVSSVAVAASAPAEPPASEAPPPSPPPPPRVPPGMAEIPGGIFWMGSEGATEDESPRHRVAVRSFLIDVHELTVAEYDACVAAGACSTAHTDHSLCNGPHPDRADHPINCIDYPQAVAGCAHAGKRLPTEREWEYAARAGAEQRPFPWGIDLPPGHACYAHEGTCKVGSYPPTAWGLYDLGGNVWEWTASHFGRYPDEPEEGLLRVYRGGSFSRRFPKWMRSGLRNRFKDTEWGAHLGVRCAKDAEGARCPDGSHDAPNGKSCVLDGEPDAKPSLTVQTSTTSPGTPTPTPAASSAPRREKEPLSVARDASFDADCAKWKPGRPISYMVRGGDFADRQQKKSQLGCVNRDVGVGFNSVCCADGR